MKSVKLLFTIIFLLVSSGFAQDIGRIIMSRAQSGDTLVVKDDVEFGGSNVLYLLMASDSMAPASRVYMLKDGGIYSLVNNPVTSSTHRTVIMGQSDEFCENKTRRCTADYLWCDWDSRYISGGINIAKTCLLKTSILK